MIMAVILPLTCIETSNLQVTFSSRIAFYNWCFQHYHYFKICLIRILNKKFWWNEIVSSTTRNFVINDQFHLNFLEVKNLCPYLWVMSKSLFELSWFTRKTSEKKFFSSKFQRADIYYWVVVRISFLVCFVRHLSALW